MNRFSKFLLVLVVPFVSMSCSNKEDTEEQEEAYEVWRMSDKAYDYNNDRKITEDDFAIYKEFTTWFKSENAFDLNGDHVITYEDYILHNQGIQSFEIWKASTDAYDYNEDGKITSNDYSYFLLIKNDIGKYAVASANINGTVNNIELKQSRLPFNAFINILCRSDFEIKKDNKLQITINSNDLPALGADYQEVQTLLNQTKFTKKTESLAEITAFVEDVGIKLEIVFYLEKDAAFVGGIRYNSSFNFVLDFGSENQVTATGLFSVVKINE